MMNKNLLALSLIAALAAVPSVSMAAQTHGDFFVNAQAGQSVLRGMTASNDTSTGSALNVGYRWNLSPTLQLGVEAGYANMGSYSDSDAITKVDGKLSGNTIGITSKFLLGRNWYMSLDGGYFAAKQRISGSGRAYVPGWGYAPFSYSESHTKADSYFTFGVGYDFNKHVGIGFTASSFGDKDKQFDLTSNLYAVDLEVRF